MKQPALQEETESSPGRNTSYCFRGFRGFFEWYSTRFASVAHHILLLACAQYPTSTCIEAQWRTPAMQGCDWSLPHTTPRMALVRHDIFLCLFLGEEMTFRQERSNYFSISSRLLSSPPAFLQTLCIAATPRLVLRFVHTRYPLGHTFLLSHCFVSHMSTFPSVVVQECLVRYTSWV